MPKGERYILGGTLGLYSTASDAINRRNKASDLKDNWNSVEGNGTPYINSFSGWQNYHPAIPIWWIPSWGGGGYEIGWVNNDDNYQATQPSVTPYTTTLGSTMTINLPRNHPDIYHVVEYDFYGVKGTISSNASTSATWTPPLSLASRIPNSSTGTGTITAKTYGGGRLVGTKTVNFVVAVPSSVVPTISHAIVEATAGLASKFGAYIQHKSKLKVANTSSGAYGSTIKSTVTEVEEKTYSGGTITTGTISGSGSIVVKTTVTDSRGRTASKSTTVSVLAYSPPKILRFSAWRANSAGNALDDGTFARVSQRFTITSLNSKNDKSWKVEYRQVGTSTWVQLDSGSVYDYDSAFNSASAILSTESSYELRLTISDYFTSVSNFTTVGTAFTLLDFNASGKGMAIGKVSEDDIFELAMTGKYKGFPMVGMEEGINSNGRYIKYDNGLLICTTYGTYFPGTEITFPASGTVEVHWTLPHAVVWKEAFVMIQKGASNATGHANAWFVRATHVDGNQFVHVSGTSTMAQKTWNPAIFIGRWK